ncbi:hypothetical protein DFR55_1381, partial [Herbinix hemicellulosilytica]|uniref:hypothetical protein n=1 Tax=Herbinix hemicellulosilytica TaxID=1564487 RepID=UPI000DFA677C
TDWHWEVFFYYNLKRWGCELTVSQTPTFIIEPYYYISESKLKANRAGKCGKINKLIVICLQISFV